MLSIRKLYPRPIYSFIFLCCLNACSNDGGVSTANSGVVSSQSSQFSLSSRSSSSFSSSSSSSSSVTTSSSEQSSSLGTEQYSKAQEHASIANRLLRLYSNLSDLNLKENYSSTFSEPLKSSINSELDLALSDGLDEENLSVVFSGLSKVMLAVGARFLDQVSPGLLEPPAGVNIIFTDLSQGLDSHYRFTFDGVVPIENCNLEPNLCSVNVKLAIETVIVEGFPSGANTEGTFSLSVGQPMSLYISELNAQNEAASISIVPPVGQVNLNSDKINISGWYDGEIADLSLESLTQIFINIQNLELQLPLSLVDKKIANHSFNIDLSLTGSTKSLIDVSAKDVQDNGVSKRAYDFEVEASQLDFNLHPAIESLRSGNTIMANLSEGRLLCDLPAATEDEVCKVLLQQAICPESACEAVWRFAETGATNERFWRLFFDVQTSGAIEGQNFSLASNIERSELNRFRVSNMTQSDFGEMHQLSGEFSFDGQLSALDFRSANGYRSLIDQPSSASVLGGLYDENDALLRPYLPRGGRIEADLDETEVLVLWPVN